MFHELVGRKVLIICKGAKDEVTEELSEQMSCAQNRMKKKYEAKHSNKSFERNLKLSPRFFMELMKSCRRWDLWHIS